MRILRRWHHWLLHWLKQVLLRPNLLWKRGSEFTASLYYLSLGLNKSIEPFLSFQNHPSVCGCESRRQWDGIVCIMIKQIKVLSRNYRKRNSTNQPQYDCSTVNWQVYFNNHAKTVIIFSVLIVVLNSNRYHCSQLGCYFEGDLTGDLHCPHVYFLCVHACS
jgi:hypothetical protein